MTEQRMISSPHEGVPAFFAAKPVLIVGVVKKPQHLLTVRDELAKLDIVDEAYVPTTTQVRTIFGKEEEIETPVSGWGRYFFVRVPLDQDGAWTAVRYLPGVMTLLPNPARPLRIAERFLEEVKSAARGEQEKLAGLAAVLRQFFKGESVDILDKRVLEMHGPVSGIVQWQRGKRVRMELSCEGSGKEVTLPADQLAPSGSPRRQTRTGSHLRRNGAITRATRIARAVG